MRRLTIVLALTAMVGASPVFGQTPTPTPTLQAKRNSAHGKTDFAAFEYGAIGIDPPASTPGVVRDISVNIPGLQPGDLIVPEPPAGSTTYYAGHTILTNNTLVLKIIGAADPASELWHYVWFDRTDAPPQPPDTPYVINTPTNTPTLTPTPTATPTRTNTPTATPT